MLTRRKLLIGFGLGTLSSAFVSHAQQTKVARIGILSARSRSTPLNPEPYFGSFVQGMRELGYVEGKNLDIEWRFADGKYELLPALAVELVQLKVKVLVTHAAPAVQALKRANTIPIVMTSTVDPVGSGFAASLARPGGNITGLSLITTDFIPEHLELLAIMMPSLSRVAVLMNPGNATHPRSLKSIQAAAQSRSVQVVPVYAGNPEEIERAFERMARERVNAAIVVTDSHFTGQRRHLPIGLTPNGTTCRRSWGHGRPRRDPAESGTLPSGCAAG